MTYEDYMREYYKERYGTDDFPKDIHRHMGKDFGNWMVYRLIEQLIKLNENLEKED